MTVDPKTFDWPKAREGETREERMAELQPIRLELNTEPKRPGSEVETRYVRGAEETQVELVSGPRNPYRDMYVFATQTWGDSEDSKITAWEDATPEARMKVVYAVMNRKALPLALEVPQFVFEVRNAARVAFDQVARMRIGVTFSSQGTRDNPHTDTDIMVPPRVYDDPKMLDEFIFGTDQAKHSYAKLLDLGATWAEARYAIPQGIVHRFGWSVNYAALSGFMGKRLRFCMEFATVAIAWKARQALAREYAVLAEPLRPECDYLRKCNYRNRDTIGEAFSNLYSGCGRWPDDLPIGEVPFSSTDRVDVERWLGEPVMEADAPVDWVGAFTRDLRYFR